VACRPVAGQRPRDKQIYANKRVSTATVGYSDRENVVSVRSVARFYKQDSWSNELVVRQSPAGKNASTEAYDIVGIRRQATTGEDKAKVRSVRVQ
jgi:hypothetical protein